MASVEYNITLRVDFDDEEKHATITEALKQAAKHVYTQALLIQDRRQPQIAVHSSNFFAGTEEIELVDDMPMEG